MNASYDPELEYVDGTLVARHVGDFAHSLVQSNVVHHLSRKHPGIYVLPSLTSQTRPTRYRIPDVTVLLELPKTRYLMDPAFLVVEILSDEDRMSEVLEKLEEYSRKGIPNIWLIDPRLGKMFTYQSNTLREVEGPLATLDPPIELTRGEVFQQ